MLLLGGCADSPSALDTGGPRAGTIATLWWIMLAIATIVFIVVVALIVTAAVRSYRKRSASAEAVGNDDNDTRLIAIGGIVIPAIVLVGLFGLTLFDLSALSAPDDPSGIVVQVTGHQWWWEVRYPNDDITTANEIHIPTGVPVEIDLLSDDVIHSFWVPQLQGKLDLIPGQANTTWIEADKPGSYRGQCAEFCGVQHANMAFTVVAEPADDYAAWVDQQRQPAPEPTTPQLVNGEQVFLGSACVYCHTIDGTASKGVIAPNLTHLASRQTLAAGTIPNNTGNLAAWILDPQHFKPGTQMPPTQLSGDDLTALLAYLESLN
jgi:cytochrome c oxidase subunit 2